MYGERKKRIRRSATLKTLEEGAAKILGCERQTVEVGPSLYLVPSRSTDGHLEVRHEKGHWICNCPYCMSGHANCSHTCAVRMMIRMREKRFLSQSRVTVPGMMPCHVIPVVSGTWFRVDFWGALHRETPAPPGATESPGFA